MSATFSLWVLFDFLAWATWTIYDSRIIMFLWSLMNLLEPLIYVAMLYFVYIFIKKDDASFKLKLIVLLLVAPLLFLIPTTLNLAAFNVVTCEALQGNLITYVYFLAILFSLWIFIFMSELKKKKQMFSWMNPKLEIRDTGKYGKGIFAKEIISKEEVVIVMGGYVLTIEDDNDLRGAIADKPIEISEYFFIGPRKYSDLALMPQHYINHSCDPNIGFKGQIFIVALKNIEKYDEIFYDYAMVMNPDERSNSYFKMDCKCGTKMCRKIITEDDWEIPYLQKKYDGYFQYFIQEKINKKLKNKPRKDASYKLKKAPWNKN